MYKLPRSRPMIGQNSGKPVCAVNSGHRATIQRKYNDALPGTWRRNFDRPRRRPWTNRYENLIRAHHPSRRWLPRALPDLSHAAGFGGPPPERQFECLELMFRLFLPSPVPRRKVCSAETQADTNREIPGKEESRPGASPSPRVEQLFRDRVREFPRKAWISELIPGGRHRHFRPGSHRQWAS